jgi:small conductance mechanosensitive channel
MAPLLNILPTDSLYVQNTLGSDSTIAQMFMDGNFEQIFQQFLTWLLAFGGKLLIIIVVFLIGRWIIRKIIHLENQLFRRVDMDCALQGFLKNLTAIGLYIALIFLIINIVGVQAFSLAALLASATLAIGLAVRDNLANFAGGVILLVNKPLKGGDHIQALDVEGIVETVGILYTVLHTFDKRTIYIPNGPLSTGNILNLSEQPTRRVEIDARVEYGVSVDEVRKALLGLVSKNDKILLDPEPHVRMMGMSETSIDFQLRVWTKVEDFWEVRFWLNEAVYTELRSKGIGMPFTKMVMHNPRKN